MADLPSETIAKRLSVKWIRKLGKGGYGEVFEAVDLSTNKHVAIKAVHLSSRPGSRKADIRKEVDLQQAVGHHPNIVRVIKKACWDNDTYWICMELCKGGDLYDVIEDHRIQNQHIQEHSIWSWFSQLVLGLQACHQPESRTGANADTRIIVHRDLKPDNIFFNEDLTVAKIGDFGMARELKEEEWATSFCGTLTHMAPEMLVEGQTPLYDERVDLWALGCILYQLCSLDYAFDHPDDNTLKHKIRTERPAPIPAHYSRSLADLVDALLFADASKRPDLDQLIAHPGVQLGIVMNTARESASHMIRLEQENEQQAHILKQAETLAKTLQAQLAEQTAKYQGMFTQGKTRIDALE
ncbi:hypothetical protein NliqN6_3378 [Naganishia liquefaciens]|uniref:non-specific serine/threonine protein kinase n=1 Tax=Naganishia liquefaciens TaxID=104408 RepID=A0A8H3TU44_9TREE|nr:hypothetical protein NliqN6_3378 [Naganishia liquefaciens]